MKRFLSSSDSLIGLKLCMFVPIMSMLLVGIGNIFGNSNLIFWIGIILSSLIGLASIIISIIGMTNTSNTILNTIGHLSGIIFGGAILIVIYIIISALNNIPF